MRPPSTACSASIEWGGVLTSVTVAASRRAFAGPATGSLGLEALRLFLGDDRHWQLHVDIRMQVQMHELLAHHAQRAARQTHFAAFYFESLTRAGLGDIRGADGTEQLALSPRFRRDCEAEILHRLGTVGRRSQMLARTALELRASLLEL